MAGEGVVSTSAVDGYDVATYNISLFLTIRVDNGIITC